ncbi:DEAD/DEAH box helicase family protein [Rhizobium leguminosarum]|uniref:DEAD/DEAH box helicase family protein n=1 Tax=Rhizobium leguminosarum TaxID=384 RepID=UPI001FEE0622|nr:DEAD/DEAH box helicase family protein [Rhizobium leguminosarum]
MIDERSLIQIKQRLSLRRPQDESLKILADIIDLIDPAKDTNVDEALEATKAMYPQVLNFERDFVSLCFALATGVGKTKLMGAFISYLYMTGKSKNFFVLAPNLTIYEKLLQDFQPQSPKYVFRGVEAFAHQPPIIVNADNYEDGKGVRGTDLYGEHSAYINIFNISKISSDVRSSARGGKPPRIKRLQEYIGDSYFKYLSELPDLVLLMDEAHRYRADAGLRAISELKPILGLELTATPKSTGAGASEFKNVIYSYSLAEAMEDEYVKEPAVGTRANFDPKSVPPEELERIKLEDGVHYHEHVRVQLQTYAKQANAKLVHPFVLVVTQDTEHARRVRGLIESDGFFGGRYKGRVAEIHSNLRGEESDENAQKLVNIEKDGTTDIVIHVNKLKEGWDVTNLYTIIPLRASAADILTEQTLGRGLRLPYGKRTGVEAVDTLTVIAHDSFNALIEAARADGSIVRKFKSLTIGDGGDVPKSKPIMAEARSAIDLMFGEKSKPTSETSTSSALQEPKGPLFTFADQRNEVAFAKTALTEVLPKLQGRITSVHDLKNSKTISEVAKEALVVHRFNTGFVDELTNERAAEVILEVMDALIQTTIAIPQIVISPTETVSFGFKAFEIEGLSQWNYQPSRNELMLQELRTDKRTVISSGDEGETENRPEDHIVKHLIDKDEIDYFAHAEILYDLASQVVAHMSTYLPSSEDIRNALVSHGKPIASAIFAQMQANKWRTDTNYKVTMHASFDAMQLKPQAFGLDDEKNILDFRTPPASLKEIKKFVFNGFKKSCFWLARFDSDTERKMAELLEREPKVLLWMKPSMNQFHIQDQHGGQYLPDFVVETTTERVILETKAANEINDAEVVRKAEAASLWCYIATKFHSERNNDKPWRYALVPHDQLLPNSTLQGLLSRYTRVADIDLIGRYIFY